MANRFDVKTRAKQHVGGFTLLELVISITLMAIIVVMAAGATTLGYRAVNSGERKIDTTERLRGVLTVMDAQIQSACPLTSSEGGPKEYVFEGTRESLRISSNYSIWGGQRGYVIAEYRVEADDHEKQALFVAETKVGMDNQKETKLLYGFDEIFFEYYSEEATEEEGQWMDYMSDEGSVPRMIRLNLLRGGAALSFIMPVRVMGTVGQDVNEDEDEDQAKGKSKDETVNTKTRTKDREINLP